MMHLKNLYKIAQKIHAYVLCIYHPLKSRTNLAYKKKNNTAPDKGIFSEIPNKFSSLQSRNFTRRNEVPRNLWFEIAARVVYSIWKRRGLDSRRRKQFIKSQLSYIDCFFFSLSLFLLFFHCHSCGRMFFEKQQNASERFFVSETSDKKFYYTDKNVICARRPRHLAFFF